MPYKKSIKELAINGKKIGYVNQVEFFLIRKTFGFTLFCNSQINSNTRPTFVDHSQLIA
jgi:hypothetical protein